MSPMVFLLTLTVLFHNLSYADIAHLYFDRNDYAQATKYFERFFIENPYKEYSEDFLLLGKCYFQLGEYTNAEDVLNKVFSLLTSSEHKAECLLLLGMIKYKRSEYEESSAIFAGALRFQTNRKAEILLWLGKSEYKKKNYSKAIELLEAAKSFHDMPQISYWYGITLLRLGRYEEADSIFSSLSANQAWRALSLLFEGYTLHLMGLNNDARKAFQSISSQQVSSKDLSISGMAHLHLGCIAMKEGKYEEATQDFRIAKEVPSQAVSDNALFRIGWCYYKQAKWDEAAEAFKIIVEEHPESEFWESACYFMGEAEYKRQRYSLALNLFERLLEEAPNSRYAPHSLYGLAYCYWHLDSLSRAIERFEEYIERYPDSELLPYARYRLGLSAYHTGDYDEVINYLKPLTFQQIPILSNEAHYLLSLSYYALSDYDSALHELKRLGANEKPLRPEAQKLLGDVLFQKEDYWRAVEAYKRICEEYSGGTVPSKIIDEARYQIERSLFKLGLYSSPITMLKVYVRKYPESSKAPKLQIELAQYYLETGQYYTAIKEFERFLELFGSRAEEAEALIGLAKAYEKLGLYERAREEYLKVTEDSPSAPKAWFDAANISFQLKLYGRAISEYQSLIEKFPETQYAEQALYMQGRCYINLRRYEEAKVVYEELLLKYPQSPKTENLRFRLAILALEDGLVEDGLKMLESEWSSDSLRGEALFASGTVLSEVGQHQDAAQKFLKASKFLSLDRKAEALFKGGEALEVIGEDSGAYLHYRDALRVVVSEKLRKKIQDKIKKLHPELNYKEGER